MEVAKNIRPQTELQDDALDTLPQTLAAVSVSKVVWYRLIRSRIAPPPVKIGRSSRWLRSEVQRFIRQQVAKRDAGVTHK